MLIKFGYVFVIYIIWSFITPLYMKNFRDFILFYIIGTIFYYICMYKLCLTKYLYSFDKVLLLFISSIIAWHLGYKYLL